MRRNVTLSESRVVSDVAVDNGIEKKRMLNVG